MIHRAKEASLLRQLKEGLCVKRKVAVAMSGGVDSSVAAALLKDRGEEVIGVTMRLWGEDVDSGPAIESAKDVCALLGIKHTVLDLREIFKKEIIDDFLESYCRGLTPNPCVMCNRAIKFGALMKLVDLLRAERLATGHYARVTLDGASGRYLLRRGADTGKDQSYFLYRLNQYQLAHAVFPLGDMRKSETIETARRMGLPSADREESQEVCFIPDNDYRGLIESERPEAVKEGDFVDAAGNIVGRHRGIAFYTEGQRRGLNYSSPGGRSYVVNRDRETNRITLGSRDDLLRGECMAAQTNWIFSNGINGPMPCEVRLRHRSTPVKCTLFPEAVRPAADSGLGRVGQTGGSPPTPDCVRIVFDEPTTGVVPGQSAVFYHGDTVLGGGIIRKG